MIEHSRSSEKPLAVLSFGGGVNSVALLLKLIALCPPCGEAFL